MLASFAAYAQASPLIPRALLFGNPERSSAQLSPDGTRVAFLAPVEGISNVWVGPIANLDAAQPITRDTGRGIRRYIWSEDGERVLYLQDSGGDENFQLYAVQLKSRALRDLTANPRVQTKLIASSPRRPAEILVGFNDRDARYHDVYRVDLRTGERALVFDSLGYTDVVADADLDVRFAVRSNSDGSRDLLRVSGGKVVADKAVLSIPVDDAFSTQPLSFEHDGKAFYMLDSRGRDKAALLKVDAATGQSTQIADDPRADIAEAIVEPGSGRVLAYEVDYLQRELVAIDPDIAKDVQSLRAKLTGSVDVVSQSRDNARWIVRAATGSEPGTYYLWERTSHELRRLFSTHPSLAALPLARMQPLEIQARDGLKLVSYLSLPPDRKLHDSGRPVPMVLLVHGGPWARDSLRFDPEHQWLANRGYAVLSVNFRGSTGFGKGFVNAGNGEWAGKMHADLIDAVDWAVAHGVTTRDKVAIFGTSYGGYSTLVGLTFTPKTFACGVDIVGPANLETLFNSVPPYWQAFYRQLVTRVGDPRAPEGREVLRSRSPLTFVDRIERPLLIGQGANDPRVKRAEPDQIVAAMSARRIPVTYVLYPDEGHGFGRPENRISFYAISEPFLARCLGGRTEPIGDDFRNATLQVLAGLDQVEGLDAALRRARPADRAR